jgi:copper(I)-binding protein
VRLLVLALLLLSAVALAHNVEKGGLQIRHPWSRATPGGAKVGVGYMEIRNRGKQAERLLGASSPLAQRVEMHVTRREGEVMRMRQVESFAIPASERVQLRPGGGHLMLVDLARPLKQGERVPLTLRFERAGEVEIEMEVQEIGSRHSRH